MSDDLSNALAPLSRPPIAPLQTWDEAPAPPRTAKSPLERPLAAVRRYKYLMAAVVIVALAAGFVATKLVIPKYEVQATIFIESETPLADRTGPIRSPELLASQAWVELLRSYRISDAVVRKLTLYLQPANKADSSLFTGFDLSDRFIPGEYELQLDKDHKRWQLSVPSVGATETGAATDSVGRKMGLRWQLSPAAFVGTGQRSVRFTLLKPRETSIALTSRLGTQLAPQSNFLWITLTDTNPQLAARTLNTWVDEYVQVAGDLKKGNLVQFANTLNDQVQYAEGELHNAESALENFRVNTITLPAEGGPVAAGVQDTREPVLNTFFEQKTQYDNLRQDRESFEKVIQQAAAGTVPYDAALLIPSVANSPGAEALRRAFTALTDDQAKIRQARQIYTDEYPDLKLLLADEHTIQTQTIPQLSAQLVDELKQREAQYDARIAGEAKDLQAIPTRTIEEMRLRRAVTVSEALYTTLKNRFAEAQLAEASATPDVRILDSAVAPLRPTKNTAPRLMLMALAGGLAAAVALALLLDLLDRRIRYPDQATNELGLLIAGAVPRLKRGGVNPNSPEQVFQLVEAFRSVRMNVTQSGAFPLSVAISSPQPSDGKSFVSTNLAMSFAEAGFKTLLIDADTRRGTLNATFNLPRTPGLTDFLSGTADRSAIVYATSHPDLWVVPSGRRLRQSPELLTSATLKQAMTDFRAEYDVVICDTPPFAAGVDAYAIATAAERLLVVLRVGQTERRLAAAKMLLLDRLPVQVVGTVLNAVQLEGEFQYYGYVAGYGTLDEESTQLART